MIRIKANSCEICIFLCDAIDLKQSVEGALKVLGKLLTSVLDEVHFIVNLCGLRLPLVPSSSKSFLPLGKSFAPSQAEQFPKLYHSFSVYPLFWGYLNFEVGINKIVSNFDYHPCPWLLASRINSFIFL